jgi:hypothetical protein
MNSVPPPHFAAFHAHPKSGTPRPNRSVTSNPRKKSFIVNSSEKPKAPIAKNSHFKFYASFARAFSH